MMIGTKEHYDLMTAFERDHSGYRLDREAKDFWPKGHVYQNGETNALFLAYRNGASFAKAYHRNEPSTPANPAQVTDALIQAKDWISENIREGDIAGCTLLGKLAELTAAIGAGGQAVAAFGEGKLVVTPGTAGGKPAVFIAPAKTPGEVGTSAKRENIPSYSLIAGEWYMTFPTDEQARLVADALCNALSQPHSADERVVEALDADYLRETLAWVRRNFEDQPKKAKEQIDLVLGHVVSALSAKEGRKNG